MLSNARIGAPMVRAWYGILPIRWYSRRGNTGRVFEVQSPPLPLKSRRPPAWPSPRLETEHEPSFVSMHHDACGHLHGLRQSGYRHSTNELHTRPDTRSNQRVSILEQVERKSNAIK